MNLTPFRGAQDPVLHAECLQILTQAAAAGDLNNLMQRLPNIFESTDTVKVTVGPLLAYPVMYAICNPTKKQMLTVCLGIGNATQAQSCIDGWETPFNPGQRTDTVLGSLQPYEAAARTLYETFGPPDSFTPLREARHIGHSFGGATSEWIADIFQNWYGFGCRPEVITYGAPKSGVSQPDHVPKRLLAQVVRVFDLADPVPLLPVHFTAGDLAFISVGSIVARKWAKWFQPNSGWTRPRGAGSLGPYLNPFYPAWGGLLGRSLVTWLLGVDCVGNLNHTIEHYVQYLGGLSWPGGVEPPPSQWEGSSGGGGDYTAVDPPLPMSVREAGRIQRIAVEIQAQAIAADPNGNALAIANQVAVQPATRYRGVIRQGTPWVFYGNVPIVPVRTKRLRRAMVRRLNRAIGL